MPSSESPVDTSPQILTREDGTVLAYYKTMTGKASAEAAPQQPGLMFLGGFMSDMTGRKALTLEAFARRRGQTFLRFDYRGHGASSGRFEDGTIGDWRDDALTVLDRLTEGPQILVGSSMGGWIMLLLALARPERIAGLVGIAAAPDFTEDLMWGRASEQERAALLRDGRVLQPSDYSEEPYVITARLIEEARGHLLLRGPLPIRCPLRLLHGLEDADVPWQTALRLSDVLESRDVELTLVKGAGHRLSEPEDLRRLEHTVARLSEMLAG